MAITKLAITTLVLSLMGSVLIPTGFVMEITSSGSDNGTGAANGSLARSVNESLCASLNKMNVTATVVLGGLCMGKNNIVIPGFTLFPLSPLVKTSGSYC